MYDTKTLSDNVLKYDVKRAYIGELTGAELSDAYSLFFRTRDWDKPVINARVHVGYIDGEIICRALWNEMSYNPKRFGTVSPFPGTGRNAIYRFCDSKNKLFDNTPGYTVVCDVQNKLRDFLKYNCLENEQWYDIVNPGDGVVIVRFIGEHSDNNYKKLAALRAAIHSIAKQNELDFKNPEYRTEMMKVIENRHPNGIRNNKKTYPISQVLDAERQIREEAQARQERLDDAEESALLTLDSRTRDSVPFEQYAQAQTDLESIYSNFQVNQR